MGGWDDRTAIEKDLPNCCNVEQLRSMLQVLKASANEPVKAD